MRADRRYTKRPFTVAACTSCTPDIRDMVMPKLHHVVRNCPHAVLVITHRLLGAISSAAMQSDEGMTLVLQPCNVDRAPVAAAQWVGPIQTEADAEAVAAWIAEGHWDVAGLPAGLRFDQKLAQSARLN